MAKKREKFLILNSVGDKEFNNLFREWQRDSVGRFVCVGCPHRLDCFADIYCFKTALVDFLMWIKSKQRGELRGHGKKA